MSGDPPNDQPPPRMPWEPEPQAPGATPPEQPPPGTGWTPPSPTDPTTVWSPAPPAQPLTPPVGDPASSAPQPPPPTGQGALLSSAPIGWGAPPPAAVEVAPGLTFASTTSRVVAYIVDMIILSIVFAIVGSIVNPTTARIDSFDELMATSTSPVDAVLTLLIDAAYFVAFWTGGRRATIGQRLFNIQVGNAFDGRALSLEQAIRRWLALGTWLGVIGVVPGLFSVAALIGFLWLIVLLITTATSPTKQGLHDRFANTALVSPSGQGTSGLAKACIVIVGVLFLLFVGLAVALVLLGDQLSTILSEIGESI
jgi:uncharacterized RDD family membrane protein YckC